jgi:hypothetical protein
MRRLGADAASSPLATPPDAFAIQHRVRQRCRFCPTAREAEAARSLLLWRQRGCLARATTSRLGYVLRAGPSLLLVSPRQRCRRVWLLGDGVRHGRAPRRSGRRRDRQQRDLGAREEPDGVAMAVRSPPACDAGPVGTSSPRRWGGTASSCASRPSCGPLEPAFGAGVPALVNVLADPTVACRRRANLA